MHRLKLEILMAMLCRLLGSLLGSAEGLTMVVYMHAVVLCCCRRAARTSVGAGGVAAYTLSVHLRTHTHTPCSM